MTGDELGQLLAAAADDADSLAPGTDPIAALARARRRRGQQRGHLAALAFVVFVLGLQLWPAEALGADRHGSVTAVTAAAAAPSPGGEPAGQRG